MTEETTETPPSPPPTPPRPTLIRPLAGRQIAGVAAALARTTGLPVGLLRVAFVLFVFAGGFGLLAYIAGWLLIPGEGEAHTAGRRLIAGVSGGWTWVGVGLMVVGVVIVADRIPFLSGDLVLAATLLVLGVLLYRGDLRPRSTPPPAIPAPPAAAATAPEVEPVADAPPDQPAGPPPPTSALVETSVIPPPPATPPPPPGPRSMLGRVTLALVLITLGGIAAADQASPLVDASPRHYLAAAVLVIGLGLLWGAWWGRARWLLLIGLFLVPPLLASPLVEFGVSSSNHRPLSFNSVSAAYSRPFGELDIDLTALPWNGEQIELDANVAGGAIRLRLPVGVGLTGRGRVGAGEIVIYGSERNQWLTQKESGLDIEQEMMVEGDQGTVLVDLEVGAGRVIIDYVGRLGG